VAYGAGGVLEIVEEGISGVLFTPQAPEALAAAVLRSEQVRWDPDRLVRRAARFDTAVFRQAFRDFVTAAYVEHRDRRERAGYPRSGWRGQDEGIGTSVTPSPPPPPASGGYPARVPGPFTLSSSAPRGSEATTWNV
jgi:hypothetical protein